ncbi:MAG: 5-(carboxyamino)imidazole ribonucleotide mutase [Dehalococcoidia bacterium]|jgi:phosphoribosylaminoimidazole carboxylase PurE protein|nr:5-(carboxyamino)imidazole ribonucleotide mutase [Dehalococcoidia bacterium]MDW8008718.1 5-(carboxyamino)imidazole ribonucleotide mutase [Chloroflexota bacterium]
MAKVAVVVGSQSDLPQVEEAQKMLERLGIECEVHVMSAHRTPEKVRQFAQGARERGIGVIIAAAGMAAHLPGVVAAWTTLPVIGLPLARSALQGLDSLLSIVQMPPGVPVACVGIDGARNAALLAASILSLSDQAVREALEAYRRELAGG